MLYKLFAPGLMKMDIRLSADWKVTLWCESKPGWWLWWSASSIWQWLQRLAGNTVMCSTQQYQKKNIKNEKGGMKLKSIINFLQCLSPAECQFYSMVMQLFKLILVMPATSAISKRSFRRVKDMAEKYYAPEQTELVHAPACALWRHWQTWPNSTCTWIYW